MINKSRSMARVAVKGGMLKAWYVYHNKLSIVNGAGNDVALCGLTDALVGWKSMKHITKRSSKTRVSCWRSRQGSNDLLM